MASVVDAVRISDQFPVAVIADTVKGCGVSFMEDDNLWHYRVPSEEEVQLALKGLGL
jgi:transketolase